MNTLAADVRPAKIDDTPPGIRATLLPVQPVIACVGQDRPHNRHPRQRQPPGEGEATMTHSSIGSAGQQCSQANALTVATASDHFDLSGLRRFTSVPDHRDIGIVALRGMVIIYDEAPIHREGVIEGAYYVRESQRPLSGLPWESWLKREWDERERRGGPAGRLHTRREVVQAIRYHRGDHWALKLAGGFVDGPYHDWAFGADLVGKVVGIYLPALPGGGADRETAFPQRRHRW